jgi:hypothetical protein
MKFDDSKLKCFNILPKYARILHKIPLREYLERIILGDEDDFNISFNDDRRLGSHNVRVLLGKDVAPPMIYIHIDGNFAAQYSYFDEEFAERSDIEL